MKKQLRVWHRFAAGGLLLSLLTGCGSVPEGDRPVAAEPSIHFEQHGDGSPVVVFQAGLGDDHTSWRALLQLLPPSLHTVVYDRPGYGRSAATAGERSPNAIADELHALLQRQGVAPPYVLVGHSLGGLYQVAFLKRYPTEVAGLVLIDPTHPDHWPRMQAEASTQAFMIKALRSTVFSGAARREFDDQLGSPDLLAGVGHGPPTVLLFSENFRPEEKGAFERMVRKLRADWPRLLPGATVRSVPGAGHYVHQDRPELVAEAIRTMVRAVTPTIQSPGSR